MTYCYTVNQCITQPSLETLQQMVINTGATETPLELSPRIEFYKSTIGVRGPLPLGIVGTILGGS